MPTAVERAQRLFPRVDARPNITHCTLITDDLVRRIKAAGAVPAAFTSYAYYNSDKFVFYGEELMKRSMAYRTLLDAGVQAAAGVEEALRVNTLNWAYNSHEEARKGSITPGKLADCVVLSDDPFTIDKSKIKDIQIVRSVVGGATVYQA